jgi:hypothetical protein
MLVITTYTNSDINWYHLKHSSKGDRLSKLKYIHTMKYYTATEMMTCVSYMCVYTLRDEEEQRIRLKNLIL